MTDYENLVKRLRNGLPCYGEKCLSCPDRKHCTTHYDHEAADAIEDMSEYVNTMRRLKCEGWYLQQTSFHDGYQAVATMPLPDPPKEET